MKRRLLKVFPPRVDKKLASTMPIIVTNDDYNKAVTDVVMYSDKDAVSDLGDVLGKRAADLPSTTTDAKTAIVGLLERDLATTKSHLPLGVKNLLSGDPFTTPIDHASILSMKHPNVVKLRSALGYNYALLTSRIDIALNHHKVRMEKGGVADTAVLQDLPTPLNYKQVIPDGEVSRRVLPRRDSLMPILIPMDAPSDVLEALESMITNLVNRRLLALGLNEEGGALVERIPLSKSGEALIKFDVKGSAGNFVVHILPVSFTDNQSDEASVFDLTKVGHTGFGFNWYESSLDSFRRGKDDRTISGESKDVGVWPHFFDKKLAEGSEELSMEINYAPFLTAKLNGHAMKKLVDNAIFAGEIGPFYSSYYPADALILGVIIDRLAAAGDDFANSVFEKYPEFIFGGDKGSQFENPIWTKAKAYVRQEVLDTVGLFSSFMDAENLAIDIAGRVAYPNAIDPSCVTCSEVPFFERIMNTLFVLRSIEYSRPVRDVVGQVSGHDLRNGSKDGNFGPLSFGNKAAADLHATYQANRRLAYDLLTSHVFYCVL